MLPPRNDTDAPTKPLPQRADTLCFLTELQLKVARRADQLAAETNAKTALNLGCWLRAEQEIMMPFWQPSPATALTA